MLAASNAPADWGLNTLGGFWGKEPAAFLLTEPDLIVIPDGSRALVIRWVWVRAGLRKNGFGLQLIGQAVMQAREKGGEFLLARVSWGWARDFFKACGFFPTGRGTELAKDIRFDKSILGEG